MTTSRVAARHVLDAEIRLINIFKDLLFVSDTNWHHRLFRNFDGGRESN